MSQRYHDLLIHGPGGVSPLRLGMLVAAALTALSFFAHAAQFQVAGQTAALFDELKVWDGSLMRRRRVVQQLRFGAYDLGGEGSGELFLLGSMRFEGDFGLSPAESSAMEGYPERDFSVPMLYLQARELWDHRLDITLGRQLRVDEVDFLLLDGARVAMRAPLHLGLEAYGGWLVRREVSPAGLEDLEPDGHCLREDESPTFGGSLYLHGIEWLDLHLGYRQSRQGDDLGRAALGLSGGLRPLSWASLDGTWVRDLLWDRDEEISFRLRLDLPSWLRWTARIQEVSPRFEAGSIFPSFGFLASRTISLHAQSGYGSLHMDLGVLHRSFPARSEDGVSEWILSPEEGASSQGLDLWLGWAPAATWELSGQGYLRQGYGGDRASLSAGGRWSPHPALPVIQAAARWLHLGGGLQPWRGGELFSVDLSATLWLWRRARLQLVLEQATASWQPWWMRVLALIDLEYWR